MVLIGETGANPVRARRREAYKSAKLTKCHNLGQHHWSNPRRWICSVPSRNIRENKSLYKLRVPRIKGERAKCFAAKLYTLRRQKDEEKYDEKFFVTLP